jgi:hypothetical protein
MTGGAIQFHVPVDASVDVTEARNRVGVLM